MSEFDKALLDFYIDMAPKYSELVNKLIKIIKEQNSKIKEAIDYIKGAYEMAIYTKIVSLEEDNIQDLLEILERTDK